VVVDAIVIGAGPAGATAGKQIALAGFEVLVLEKSSSPGKNKICGGAMSRKSFADLSLPEEIIEKELSRFVVHFQEQEFRIPNKNGFALFDRESLDRFLVKKASEKGATVRTSTLVSDIAKCSDGLSVHYRKLPEREREEERARIVVFADGTNTLAFRKLQVGFDGRPEHTALAAAYDLKCPDNNLDSLDFYFSEEISSFGYGWIFPKRDLVNVGVLCLLSKMKHNIRSCLDRFVVSSELGSREIIRFGCRLIPQSCVEKLHDDSVLVAGDAAGTADPIDGGGIFNAVISGEVAGKVAVDALEAGALTADFLAKYAGLWKKTGCHRLFQRSYLLQKLALKADVNMGVFLKQMGFFTRDTSIE
jgi:geranylgeranyl reductase family protein